MAQKSGEIWTGLNNDAGLSTAESRGSVQICVQKRS